MTNRSLGRACRGGIFLVALAFLLFSAEAATLEGRWRLVEQSYGEGQANLVRTADPLILEFGGRGPQLEARLHLEGPEARSAPWPAFAAGERLDPVEVRQLELARDGDLAVFRVSDAGSGVPPGIAERIMEPFVSGREGGTGLGLSVTRAIAQAHGGSLNHDRKDGLTVFSLRVPAGNGG